MHWIDPDHLPQTVGNVLQFTQNAKGELDGLILDKDRQVHFPPHLGPKVAKLIAVGDKVHVRGVRPRGASVIAAVSLKVSGDVRLALHGPRGELWGALLDDGTVVRLGPKEAAKKAKQLAPGMRFSAKGWALENRFGRVVEIGPGERPKAGAKKKAAKKKKG